MRGCGLRSYSSDCELSKETKLNFLYGLRAKHGLTCNNCITSRRLRHDGNFVQVNFL
jgi:hypothetical protein